MMFGLESSLHPFIGHPSYREIADLPLSERVKIMKDPAFKEKLLNEKPNFASEIEKSMNEQDSAKSQEEIKRQPT